MPAAVNTPRPVAVLHVFSGDLWAGAEVMIANLLGTLRCNPEVRLAALALNEGLLARRLREAGVDTIVVPEAGRTFPSLVAAAVRRLRGRRFDVIHAHRYKENLLAACLAPMLGRPRLVSTLHGLPEPLAGTAPRRLRAGIRGALNRRVLRRRFTRVVAVSRDVQRVLIEEYRLTARAVPLIYNGVPVAGAAGPGGEPSPPRRHVGTMARLVPVKDLGLFLRVAAAVRRQAPDVRFSILGDGPERGLLLAERKALGLEEVVDLFPHRDDPGAYVRSLGVYLNTSLHEGLPLAVLEAMAAGTPVVAPRVGGLPEVVTDGVEGRLVASRDPEAFAAACLDVLSDAERHRRLGEAARHRVDAVFSSRAMADGYHALYRELCPAS